mmetsp:Transcript_21446/g.61181  ORF Transcript_21446/g.61181 Transcript_21446/m.61181 type:complete len:325 (+) Transcript_21446:92-1066(+)
MARERQPGDWDCPDCGAVCFASRETCFRCDRKNGLARKEGDWDCPDCGTVIFAGKESCFKCDRIAAGGGGGPRQRREGDWDCPDCGALVFAGKETCFKCAIAAGGGPVGWDCPACGTHVRTRSTCVNCGESRPAGAGKGRGKSKAAAAPEPSESLRTLARLSPTFKKAWVAYCKQYGQGTAEPSKYDEAFITEFADYTAGLIMADLSAPPEATDEIGSAENGKRAATDAEEAAEAPPAKAAKADAGAAATEKKKVTMKRAVATKIQALNKAGGLLAPIRLATVAVSLGQLEESVALEVLNLLEEQQAEVEDPNEFIRNQAEFRV